jgi:hypothetical protein
MDADAIVPPSPSAGGSPGWRPRWGRSLWNGLRVRREQSWTFTLVVGAAFAILQIALHARHELWRDEIHTWTVARNAGGFWDLVSGDRRYDGHPILWYYLLYLIARLTRDPVGLHLAAAIASVVAAVLWLRAAPLPRWLRLMLLLSYDFFYEYGVMCRSYGVGVCLTFAFCALYDRGRIRYFTLGVLLSLLAATSLYGTILASVMGLFLYSRGLVVAAHPSIPDRWALSISLNWAAGVALLAATLAFVAFTSHPPADAAVLPQWSTTPSWEGARLSAERFWWGMFPVRTAADWGWIVSSYLGQNQTWFKPLLPALVAVILLGCAISLRRSPRVVAMMVLGMLMMAVAQRLIYDGWLRHWGHYLILLLASVWLLARETRVRASMRVVQGVLAVALAVQSVTGVKALILDWRQPFSSAREAAQFIARTGRRNIPTIGDTDHPSSTVAGYLDRSFLYAQSGDVAGTVTFHNQRHGVAAPELVESARALAARSQGVALIVTNHDLAGVPATGFAMALLYHTAPSLVPDEEFYIYEVRVPT